jgi:hypothetical protein
MGVHREALLVPMEVGDLSGPSWLRRPTTGPASQCSAAGRDAVSPGRLAGGLSGPRRAVSRFYRGAVAGGEDEAGIDPCPVCLDAVGILLVAVELERGDA